MPAKKTTKVAGKISGSTGLKRSTKINIDTREHSSPSKDTALAIPTKELDQWIKGRVVWSHQEWVQLLESLRNKGYQQAVDNYEWQKAVGKYLEEARMKNIKLPTEELNQWLKTHRSWDHNEWLGLLAQLRAKGYTMITDNEFGQALIGRYLEEHKKR